MEGEKLCFNVPSLTWTSLDSIPLTVFSQYQLKEGAGVYRPQAVKGLISNQQRKEWNRHMLPRWPDHIKLPACWQVVNQLLG